MAYKILKQGVCNLSLLLFHLINKSEELPWCLEAFPALVCLFESHDSCHQSGHQSNGDRRLQDPKVSREGYAFLQAAMV